MSGLGLARSYTSVLAQQWLIYGVSLMTFGVIARLLDTHDIGIYGLMVSIIYLIGLSSNFGIKRVAIKLISQSKELDPERARRIFWLSILVGGIFIILISALTMLTLQFFKIFSFYRSEDLYYISFFILLTIFSIRNHASLGLEALKEFHILAVYTGLGFITYRLLMITSVILGYKLLGIIISWIIGETIATVLIFYKIFKGYSPLNIDFSITGDILRESPPIFVSDLILSLMDYGDRVLTSIFGYSAVAFFYIASTGAMALGAFAQALYNGLLPHLSEEYSINGVGLINRLKSINRYVYLFISPIYLMGVALSYPLISILVGPGYSQAAAIFQIISLGLWIASIAPINQAALIAAGRGYLLMNIMLVGLITEFASIILLYPYIGVLATGFGKALLLVIGFVLSTILIMKEWGLEPVDLRDYITPTAAAIISASITWLSWIILARLDLIILNVSIGLASYLYLLRLFKAIKADEIATLYSEIPFKDKLKYILRIICYIAGVDYNHVLELVRK